MYTNRKDMQFPCRTCADKTIGCTAGCQKPEYLQVLELYKKLHADKAKHYRENDYERKKIEMLRRNKNG